MSLPVLKSQERLRHRMAYDASYTIGAFERSFGGDVDGWGGLGGSGAGGVSLATSAGLSYAASRLPYRSPFAVLELAGPSTEVRREVTWAKSAVHRQGHLCCVGRLLLHAQT